MFHYHGDTVSRPEHFKLLASSELYENQIIEFENHTIGLQCHAEVNNDILKEWEVLLADELKQSKNGLDLKKFREQRRAYGDTLKKQTQLFFNEWLDRLER